MCNAKKYQAYYKYFECKDYDTLYYLWWIVFAEIFNKQKS